MKKKFKKIASLVLAVVMAFAMAVPAMAASITMQGDNCAGHTYNVYQIFTGDVAKKDGKDVLSNVKYGQNYVPTDKKIGDSVDPETLEKLEDMDGNDLAADFLTDDGTYTITDKDPFATLPNEGAYSLEVPDGYYIIEDVTAGDNVVHSAYIVEVVGEAVKITPKATDIPKFEKKVQEKNDSTGDESGWQDGADYDIGDSVPFKLEATIPEPQEQFDRYDTYKLVFHDKMSEGLTLVPDSIKVKKNGELIEGGYELKTGKFEDGCTFEVIITDVKAAPISAKSGYKITVEFNATLNDSANIGEAGNPNTAHLEYSNNPDNDGTGKTPDDEVTVFTYKLIVNKTDGTTEEALAGAGFTLFKNVGEDGAKDWQSVGEQVMGGGANEATFTWDGLDAGEYRLEETTVPAGYNKAPDLYFTVTGEYTPDMKDGREAPTLTKLVVKDSEGNILSEQEGVETPTFTTHVSLTQADMNTTVVNNRGATLPETGGIGTTIFYVAGSVLVLAAVVLLVTKRRMNSK